jgi:hypothetical protein
MANDGDGKERRHSDLPGGSPPPEAGHRPGEHPTVRRSGIVGPQVGIAIATGLVLAALTYVAVVAGIIG